MSNILFSDEKDRVQNVNIDELFEKNQQKDLKQLSIFNKILNRIHKRIQHTGKSKGEKFIFYQVPEYLFGEPQYKQGDCIGFLVIKLEENGFEVKYMHPNTLFITWKNHVPSYVRNEIKKKTGVVVDEKGNILNHIREPSHRIRTSDEMRCEMAAPDKHSKHQTHPNISNKRGRSWNIRFETAGGATTRGVIITTVGASRRETFRCMPGTGMGSQIRRAAYL